jgi:ubiquinone/menaquinone biosynthesis C-methylase UbiE
LQALDQNTQELEKRYALTPKADLRDYKLADAQWLFAREHGFSNWAELKKHVLAHNLPKDLSQSQYKDSRHLTTRIDLRKRFTKTTTSWYRWVFDQLELPPEAHILEIGSGSGNLWQENLKHLPPSWQIILSDASDGMLTELRSKFGPHPQFRVLKAQAETLPFRTSSVDAVIANHMLYHVSDQTKVLQEVKRVLKPSGRFYASTGSREDMKELLELYAHLAEGDFLEQLQRRSSMSIFNFENGQTLLKTYFSTVRVSTLDTSLGVTDADAIVDYLLSTVPATPLREAPTLTQKEHIEQLKIKLRLDISKDGSFHIRSNPCLFEAMNLDTPSSS